MSTSTPTTIDPPLRLPLDHLATLSDRRGLFEHADHDIVRREHGYCLDDVARGLIVAVREGPGSTAAPLVETYLSFVERAIQDDGRAHNRMDTTGAWTDEPADGDWWGRALLALGFAGSRAERWSQRRRARTAFERAATRRSPHLRAMASAAVGAADLLEGDPDSASARALLVDAVAIVPEPTRPDWPWPEPRLRYGNAAIAEALLAAGHALDDDRLTERGLAALSFLLAKETRDGHLSVTGTAGRGPGEDGVQFDQQPIEVAAIADACARAFVLGHGVAWSGTVRLAWSWFLGNNDAGVAMIDPASGAGFDGLTASGRNENRGAESTLAALSTLQQVRVVGAGRAPARAFAQSQ